MDTTQKVTAQELANLLDGCVEISEKQKLIARNNDLVIVYGYSDDNVELDGAIYDEVGAFDGGTVYLAGGTIVTECDNPCDHCSNEAVKSTAKRIEAHWNKDGYSWVMEAKDGIVAYPFDMRERSEDDEYFCKGLVFELGQVQ